MSIRHALDALAATLQRTGSPLFTQLADGLSPTAVSLSLGSLPIRVATEVHEYFAWRNGLRPDRASAHELFPDAVMLSLGEAITHYQMLCGVAAQVAKQTGAPPAAIWNPRWLPLFIHPAGGAFHVTLAVDDGSAQSPIISILQEDVSGATMAFDSLSALAITVNECYATGAYAADHGGIREDRQRAAAIVRAHNRDVVDNAASWLRPSS